MLKRLRPQDQQKFATVLGYILSSTLACVKVYLSTNSKKKDSVWRGEGGACKHTLHIRTADPVIKVEDGQWHLLTDDDVPFPPSTQRSGSQSAPVVNLPDIPRPLVAFSAFLVFPK